MGGQWRELLHLTYLSMNLRWNSERTVSLMKCFSWAKRTMKDSMNISISHCVTEVCSHSSHYYIKLTRYHFQTGRLYYSYWLVFFAWTSIFCLVPRPHPLTRRNGQVSLVTSWKNLWKIYLVKLPAFLGFCTCRHWSYMEVMASTWLQLSLISIRTSVRVPVGRSCNCK